MNVRDVLVCAAFTTASLIGAGSHRSLLAQGLEPAGRVITIWPEGVPGGKPNGGEERNEDGRVSNVHNPTLTFYAPYFAAPPSRDVTTSAVIVCPGGGYARLAIANEALGAVRALTPRSVAVFVLKYRLGEYGQPAPLQDVLRAIRLVRSRAAEFHVDPSRIGVFGASAGGHVAASAAAMFDAPEGRTGVAVDEVSARPDFVALLYPVITMRAPFAHADSKRNLLGPAPTGALIDRWSLEAHVRSDMPPVFLVHTAEDRSVPIEQSQAFVEQLRRAGVPVEAHFYEKGAHGFGMSNAPGTTAGWVNRWIEWMGANGWL